MSRLLRLALLVLLLAACATEPMPPNPGPPAALPPSPSPGSSEPAEPTGPVEETNGSATPTRQAAGPPPRSADLQWEVIDETQGRLRNLLGLPAPALSTVPSPDGRWWATSIFQEETEGGPPYVSLYIVDGEANNHWIASNRFQSLMHPFDWTPDGRLLWVDEGRLFIANGDGYGRRDLEAPEVILEVWYGGDSVALAAGEEGLWRVDIETGNWDRVESGGQEEPSIARGGSNLHIAPDGTFAALIDGGSIFRVPLSAGERASYLTTFEYPGRGGRINPLYPLADSSLWASGEPYFDPAQQNAFRTFFVDSTDNEIIPVTAFHPPADPSGFPEVSPDGRWFALREGEPFSQRADAYYIAPASVPSGGRVIEAGTLLGWVPEREAALLGTADRELIRLDLQSWTTQRLLEGVDLMRHQVAFDGEETIFVAGDYVLHAITLDGRERGVLESPVPYAIAAAGSRFMATFQQNGEYALWLWEPSP